MHPFGEALSARDAATAVSLLATDVTFRSPVVFKPYRGRDAVAPVLHAIVKVFRDFRYTREIGAGSGSELALVFEASVGDRQIEGCDFLRLDDSGAVQELVVMIRPLSGIHALAEAMRAQLESGA